MLDQFSTDLKKFSDFRPPAHIRRSKGSDLKQLSKSEKGAAVSAPTFVRKARGEAAHDMFVVQMVREGLNARGPSHEGGNGKA